MIDDNYYSQFFKLGTMDNLFSVKGVVGVNLATKNRVTDQVVYGERLFETEFGQLREFSHNRSKLASSLVSGLRIPELTKDTSMLYLGASFGTTVSHVSDILSGKGKVFALEFAPRPMRDLLYLAETRENIIPILGDARFPDKYQDLVHSVDFLYSDVAQANQSEIFIKNAEYFLRRKGTAFIAIKAKSISQVIHPKKVFRQQKEYLEDHGMEIIKEIDIGKYHRDHMVFLGRWY